MSYTIHDAAIGPMIRMLESLSKIIDKAVTQAKTSDTDLKVLLEAQFAPDMLSFTRQIQLASDAAKSGAARLAGVTPPSFPDTETTFPELKDRIAKTIAYLKSVTPDKLAGADTREIELKTPSQTFKFPGRDFLNLFVLPNFYFHATTAYDLLRHKGIQIGKMDYLGGV